MNLPPIILASASPRRVELLRQLVEDFDVVPARVEEVEYEHLTARELCLLNAHRKAHAVAKRFPDRLVLGADTMVYLEHRLFGKPADRAEARRMLEQLQGQTHLVTTGVCLLHRRHHQEAMFGETTSVVFRPLSLTQIDAYLNRVNPLDKAGAYAIQEHGDTLIANVSGSYSNVVGLPLERLREVLENW